MELTDSSDNDCKEGSEDHPSSKSTEDANPMAMLLPSEINEFVELYGIEAANAAESEYNIDAIRLIEPSTQMAQEDLHIYERVFRRRKNE
jgi:hypothetical protein